MRGDIAVRPVAWVGLAILAVVACVIGSVLLSSSARLETASLRTCPDIDRT